VARVDVPWAEDSDADDATTELVAEGTAADVGLVVKSLPPDVEP